MLAVSDENVLVGCTAKPYSRRMFTIIETEIFKRYAEFIWDDVERHEFII